MPTTTNYGWTTPADTDLVKDGASAIRSLGSAIDTSLNTALGTKKSGLVLLATQSFSAVATSTFPANSFSSNYTNYMAICRLDSQTADGAYGWRLVNGASAASTAYYTGGIYVTVGGTISGRAGSNVTYFHLGEVDAGTTARNSAITWFNSPNVAVNTHMFAQAFMTDMTGGYFSYQNNGNQNDATSYDTLQLYITAGNMTGSMALYGVNK